MRFEPFEFLRRDCGFGRFVRTGRGAAPEALQYFGSEFSRTFIPWFIKCSTGGAWDK